MGRDGDTVGNNGLGKRNDREEKLVTFSTANFSKLRVNLELS